MPLPRDTLLVASNGRDRLNALDSSHDREKAFRLKVLTQSLLPRGVITTQLSHRFATSPLIPSHQEAWLHYTMDCWLSAFYTVVWISPDARSSSAPSVPLGAPRHKPRPLKRPFAA